MIFTCHVSEWIEQQNIGPSGILITVALASEAECGDPPDLQAACRAD